MKPKMLAIILFHLFSKERVFFFFTKSLFTKFFIILAKFKQGGDEWNTGAFGRVHKVHFSKATYASFANFIIWSAFEPCLISSMNLRILPNKFEKFLAGFVQKDLHPNFTVVLLQGSLNKIQQHAEFD